MTARITDIPLALRSRARDQFGHRLRMNADRAGNEFLQCLTCGARIELFDGVWGGTAVGWDCDEVAAGLPEGES